MCKIINAIVNPMHGWANPPSLKIVVDKYPELISTDYYHLERNEGGHDAFLRIRNFEIGAVSTCIFPIPSCWNFGRSSSFVGAGRDEEYGMTDGWYDSGSMAIDIGVIEDMVELAITDHEGGGGIVWMLPVSTVREAMAEFCPEWILRDSITGNYYSCITRADGTGKGTKEDNGTSGFSMVRG